jgi:Flp pilus assembly protein protease CpaA
LAIVVVVSVPLGVLAYRNVIGGGDAKMIAASFLLVSPGRAFELLLAIAVAGGALSVICLLLAAVSRWHAMRGVNMKADGSADRAPSKLGGPEGPGAIQLPYGAAILAGVALVMARRG